MTDMTPEEINQMIAEWAGIDDDRECNFAADCPALQCWDCNAYVPPDYFHTNAAMDLLGVLVERGCTYKMLGAPDTHYMAIGDSTGYCPMAATKCQKTPSAAICTAIIELIEREGR